MNTAFLSLAIGILLVVLGRKLFWLVVAVMGFVSGFEWVPLFFHNESRVVILTVALAMGLVRGGVGNFSPILGGRVCRLFGGRPFDYCLLGSFEYGKQHLTSGYSP